MTHHRLWIRAESASSTRAPQPEREQLHPQRRRPPWTVLVGMDRDQHLLAGQTPTRCTLRIRNRTYPHIKSYRTSLYGCALWRNNTVSALSKLRSWYHRCRKHPRRILRRQSVHRLSTARRHYCSTAIRRTGYSWQRRRRPPAAGAGTARCRYRTTDH